MFDSDAGSARSCFLDDVAGGRKPFWGVVVFNVSLARLDSGCQTTLKYTAGDVLCCFQKTEEVRVLAQEAPLSSVWRPPRPHPRMTDHLPS